MRKLVLAVVSLAAVVLLALLVHVADRDDRGPVAGSYERLGGRPHHGDRHHAFGHGHGKKLHRLPGQMRGHRPGRMPGGGVPRPSYVEVACHLEGNTVVLDYTYRSGDRVGPFFDLRDGVVVAGVRVKPSHRTQAGESLRGQARFALVDPPRAVRNPDGSDLPCPPRKP